jgi:hypothetical protein
MQDQCVIQGAHHDFLIVQIRDPRKLFPSLTNKDAAIAPTGPCRHSGTPLASRCKSCAERPQQVFFVDNTSAFSVKYIKFRNVCIFLKSVSFMVRQDHPERNRVLLSNEK